MKTLTEILLIWCKHTLILKDEPMAKLTAAGLKMFWTICVVLLVMSLDRLVRCDYNGVRMKIREWTSLRSFQTPDSLVGRSLPSFTCGERGISGVGKLSSFHIDREQAVDAWNQHPPRPARVFSASSSRDLEVEPESGTAWLVTVSGT